MHKGFGNTTRYLLTEILLLTFPTGYQKILHLQEAPPISVQIPVGVLCISKKATRWVACIVLLYFEILL
ncbi:hypothetical protein HNQ91_003038 [Filimonas zeae]|nr:hypothetical protein [Filimonas zeae]